MSFIPPSLIEKTNKCLIEKFNKTPRGVSVGCIGLRIASQGQDEWQIEQSQQTSMISQEDWVNKNLGIISV